MNRVLKAICGLLILFVGSHILLQLASIPRYYQRVTSGTVPTLLMGGTEQMSNALIAQWAAERGMSLQSYALYVIALNLVITIGFGSVAVLILLKARREWFHWFTALVLLFVPTGGLWEFTQVSGNAYTYVSLGGLLWPLFLLFLYLFPNGKAVPRWMRWPMGVIAVLHLIVQSAGLALQLSFGSPELLNTAYSLFPVVLAAFPLILFCQVYRYLRVSTPTEQAQIRWFVVGLALWLVTSQLIDLLTTIPVALINDLDKLLMLIIPAAIGIGILRYRLYDIDLIIRRTLVYTLLTGTLALLYFGSVVVSQQLFRTISGSSKQSSISIVISTLAIAALFNPLRRGIQNFINRRFYRQHYDTERTLQTFSTAMQEEVNLEQMCSRLLTVTNAVIQPTHISLWLRPMGDPSLTPQTGDSPTQSR